MEYKIAYGYNALLDRLVERNAPEIFAPERESLILCPDAEGGPLRQ